MNRKKILFFQHASDIGGASWCLLEIIQELDLHDYEPVVVIKQDGDLKKALEDLGVKVRFLNEFAQITCNYVVPQLHLIRKILKEMIFLKRRISAAQSICVEEDPDIVYLNSITYFPIAVSAKRAGVRHVILHIREHFKLSKLDPRRVYWNNVVSRYVDTIFSISRTGSQVAGFPERTTIVRDWPDFTSRGDQMDIDIYSMHGLPRNKPMILVPGGNSPGKGTIYAIKAFRKLKSTGSILVALGTTHTPRGGFKGFVRKALSLVGIQPLWLRIQRLGEKTDNIYLLPRVHSMKQFFAEAAVVVSPFIVPHCAKTALEAALLETPSILSDFGESREYVEHGISGYIVRPKSVHDLAEKMKLVCDKELLNGMGRQAYIHTAEEFSKEKNMALILRELSAC